MSVSSNALEGYEFLAQTVNQGRLRGEAKNILDSYSHTWDILAEALQNSVDAIDQRFKQTEDALAIIKIVFDTRLRSIEISDTGTGMSIDEIKNVLAPHQGYKRGKGLRGEKGVGLSFILFLTNRFRIETCNGDETVSLEVHRANDWVQGSTSEGLKFVNVNVTNPTTFEGSSTFTRIWAEGIPTASESDDEDIFSYTRARLEYILRTKTAIGNTASIFDSTKSPSVKIDVQLKYIDNINSTQGYLVVPYLYATPSSYLKDKDILTCGQICRKKSSG